MGTHNVKTLPDAEPEAVTSAERRAWVRPEVRRMAAGSAEEGANPNPDAGAFPS